jgi:hypothetical protein
VEMRRMKSMCQSVPATWNWPFQRCRPSVSTRGMKMVEGFLDSSGKGQKREKTRCAEGRRERYERSLFAILAIHLPFLTPLCFGAEDQHETKVPLLRTYSATTKVKVWTGRNTSWLERDHQSRESTVDHVKHCETTDQERERKTLAEHGPGGSHGGQKVQSCSGRQAFDRLRRTGKGLLLFDLWRSMA